MHLEGLRSALPILLPPKPLIWPPIKPRASDRDGYPDKLPKTEQTRTAAEAGTRLLLVRRTGSPVSYLVSPTSE
jgi:hypothetical protein